jgi:hypothetical protein
MWVATLSYLFLATPPRCPMSSETPEGGEKCKFFIPISDDSNHYCVEHNSSVINNGLFHGCNVPRMDEHNTISRNPVVTQQTLLQLTLKQQLFQLTNYNSTNQPVHYAIIPINAFDC